MDLVLCYDLGDLTEYKKKEEIPRCKFIFSAFKKEEQETVFAKMPWKELTLKITKKAKKGKYYKGIKTIIEKKM